MDAPTQSSQLYPMSDEEFRWKVSHSGKISLPAVHIAAATLLSLALSCFIGRLSIRIITRRRLYLDDCVLFIAVGTLCVATATFYHCSFHFFLMIAISHHPELMVTTAFTPYINFFRRYKRAQMIFFFLCWTVIFAVKFSFFALFRPLIRHSRRITMVYWFFFAFTVFAVGVSHAIIVIFFNSTSKFSEYFDRSLHKTTGVCIVCMAAIDIMSDIMIISIPLLLLRNSSMKFLTKLGIGSCLCLSLVMIICSIIWSVMFCPGTFATLAPAWGFVWPYTEGCIGVIMASLTAYRTLLVSHHNRRAACQSIADTSEIAIRWFSKIRSPQLRTHGNANIDLHKNMLHIKLPTIPSATFTGIQSFIQRNYRGGRSTTNVESEYDSFEAGYHTAIRRGFGQEGVQRHKILEP